jgi:hypothetical protein
VARHGRGRTVTGRAEQDQLLVDSTLGFYRQTVDWLAHHHANLGRDSSHDLDAADRWNAVWKLSGQSLAHTYALLELLQAGYTGQTWALMRSIHEVDRLLVAVCNSDEERIPRRWLADQQVKQSEARASEQAEARKLAEEMHAAGIEPVTEDVEQFTQKIYAGMSKAAHHRRSIVDEAIDAESRTMIYGPDPRADRRVAFTVYAGALVHEVTLLVGGAVAQLYGPGFYAEHLAPMLRQLETTLAALDVIDFARRMGFAEGGDPADLADDDSPDTSEST